MNKIYYATIDGLVLNYYEIIKIKKIRKNNIFFCLVVTVIFHLITMDWQPNVEGLQQLVQLFSQSNNSSQEIQAKIYKVRNNE